MEDYMRGILCGYLSVQRSAKGDSKKQRMFLVLSDSRLDYYDVDPRPAFEHDIADAYIFTPATRVHYYVEINAKAPAHSLCLTADKTTHVFVAESDADATIWYKHLHERLEALASMVTGTLMLRKEISVHQQFQRLLLQTKYKWKSRYIELGRSSLRFCKASGRTTRMMKQFMLTAQSFVSDEPVEFLQQHRVLASYATPIEPDAKMLSRFKKEMRDQHYANTNASNGSGTAPPPLPPPTRSASTLRIAPAFPFVVATGQTHLYLAAPSDNVRTDWIVAIRMRIISLKYRHNSEKTTGSKNGDAFAAPIQLQGFMDVQLARGGAWKQHFVELDNNILRVKGSECTVGAKFETALLPTCTAAPTLLKANAFVVRNLRQEIALAPSSIREAERWMATLLRAGSTTSVAKYVKVFDDDIRALLRHSTVYSLVVPSGASAGLVVERYKKRIVVLSHEPPEAAAAATSSSTLDRMNSKRTSLFARATSLPTAAQRRESTPSIPRGSALVAIAQCEMAHESFETVWHHLRHKKGARHEMILTFRVPAIKHGVVGVRLRARDPFVLCRCALEGGTLSITSNSDSTIAIAAELPLRNCNVELASDDDCVNGITLTCSGSSSAGASTSTVHLSIASDADVFHWFVLLYLEAAIAQDDTRYPLTVATLARGKKPLKRTSDVAADQRQCFQTCAVVGMRIDDIERLALETDPLQCLKPRDPQDDLRGGSSSSNAGPGVGVVTSNSSKSASSTVQQLSDADSLAFFQHIDAIGCGKVSTVALVRTLEMLTRHIKHHDATVSTIGTDDSDSARTSTATTTTDQQQQRGRHSVLAAFYSALDARVTDCTHATTTTTDNISNSVDNRSASSSSLTRSEFLQLLASVTDATVVDVVQKLVRHDIQCV